MTPYERFCRSELILRDELALDRTRLANERTLLAYARTAIMVLASGVTLVKFFPDERWIEVVGLGLIPVGLIVGAIGVHRFGRLHRSLGVLRPARQETGCPVEAAQET